MSSTDNLNMPYVKAAQSQKHVTINQSLQLLDAAVQLSVISQNLSTPPAEPGNGDRYIVPTSSVNDWADRENNVAVWADNYWLFLPPRNGWRAWVEDENVILVWNGSGWIPSPVSVQEIQNLGKLGLNSSATSTSRFNVKSEQVTFEAEVDDIRHIFNKTGDDDTSSIIFQSASVGKAEIGLTGDNDFHIRVSEDGTNWNYAVSTDNATQECYFHAPPVLPQFSISSLPSTTFPARLIYVTDAAGGPVTAFCDGTNWKRISDNTIIN